MLDSSDGVAAVVDELRWPLAEVEKALAFVECESQRLHCFSFAGYAGVFGLVEGEVFVQRNGPTCDAGSGATFVFIKPVAHVELIGVCPNGEFYLFEKFDVHAFTFTELDSTDQSKELQSLIFRRTFSVLLILEHLPIVPRFSVRVFRPR